MPGKQRSGRGAGGPRLVVGAEEPDGIETGTGGLERAHDLHRRVARLRREEGFRGDALERGEGVGKANADAGKVEGCEFVERALPLATGLELNAVQQGRRSPPGSFEQLMDGCSPVGVGALGGQIQPAEECTERAQMVEQDRKAAIGMRDQHREAVKRNPGLEEMPLSKDKGVKLRAGQNLGFVRGEVGREQKSGDAVERKRPGGPAQQIECGRGQGRGGKRDTQGELVWAGRGGCGDVVEFGGKNLAEDAIDLRAGRLDCGKDDGDAGVRLPREARSQPLGAGGQLVEFAGGGGKSEIATSGWLELCVSHPFR